MSLPGIPRRRQSSSSSSSPYESRDAPNEREQQQQQRRSSTTVDGVQMLPSLYSINNNNNNNATVATTTAAGNSNNNNNQRSSLSNNTVTISVANSSLLTDTQQSNNNNNNYGATPSSSLFKMSGNVSPFARNSQSHMSPTIFEDTDVTQDHTLLIAEDEHSEEYTDSETESVRNRIDTRGSSHRPSLQSGKLQQKDSPRRGTRAGSASGGRKTKEKNNTRKGSTANHTTGKEKRSSNAVRGSVGGGGNKRTSRAGKQQAKDKRRSTSSKKESSGKTSRSVSARDAGARDVESNKEKDGAQAENRRDDSGKPPLPPPPAPQTTTNTTTTAATTGSSPPQQSKSNVPATNENSPQKAAKGGDRANRPASGAVVTIVSPPPAAVLEFEKMASARPGSRVPLKQILNALRKSETAMRTEIERKFEVEFFMLQNDYARECLAPMTAIINNMHNEMLDANQKHAKQQAQANETIHQLMEAVNSLANSVHALGSDVLHRTNLLKEIIPLLEGEPSNSGNTTGNGQGSATQGNGPAAGNGGRDAGFSNDVASIHRAIDGIESQLYGEGRGVSTRSTPSTFDASPMNMVRSIADAVPQRKGVPVDRHSEAEQAELSRISAFFSKPQLVSDALDGMTSKQTSKRASQTSASRSTARSSSVSDAKTTPKRSITGASTDLSSAVRKVELGLAALLDRLARGHAWNEKRVASQEKLVESYASRVVTADRIIDDTLRLGERETRNAIAMAREMGRELRDRMAHIETDAREALDRLILESVDTTLAFEDDPEEVATDTFFNSNKEATSTGKSSKWTRSQPDAVSMTCKREVIPSRYLSRMERNLVEQGKLLRDARHYIIDLYRSHATKAAAVAGIGAESSGADTTAPSGLPTIISGKEEFSVLCHSGLPLPYIEHMEQLCSRGTLLRMLATVSLRGDSCDVLMNVIDEHDRLLHNSPAEASKEGRLLYVTRQLESAVNDVWDEIVSGKAATNGSHSPAAETTNSAPFPFENFLQRSTQEYDATESIKWLTTQNHAEGEESLPATGAANVPERHTSRAVPLSSTEKRVVRSYMERMGVSDVELMWRVLRCCGYCQAELPVVLDEWKDHVVTHAQDKLVMTGTTGTRGVQPLLNESARGGGTMKSTSNQMSATSNNNNNTNSHTYPTSSNVSPSVTEQTGKSFFDLTWVPQGVQRSDTLASQPSEPGSETRTKKGSRGKDQKVISAAAGDAITHFFGNEPVTVNDGDDKDAGGRRGPSRDSLAAALTPAGHDENLGEGTMAMLKMVQTMRAKPGYYGGLEGTSSSSVREGTTTTSMDDKEGERRAEDTISSGAVVAKGPASMNPVVGGYAPPACPCGVKNAGNIPTAKFVLGLLYGSNPSTDAANCSVVGRGRWEAGKTGDFAAATVPATRSTALTAVSRSKTMNNKTNTGLSATQRHVESSMLSSKLLPPPVPPRRHILQELTTTTTTTTQPTTQTSDAS